MNGKQKEKEIYNSQGNVDWGVLATPLIQLENTNGHHTEKSVSQPLSELPSYISERFSIEDIVELLQGHQLEAALSKHPYPSKEHGADQIEEGRRFPYDFHSDWKRSDREVKRYLSMVNLIESNNLSDQVLEELLKRWVTPINIGEIALHLQFTPEDVTAIADNPRFNSITEPTRNSERGLIDKQAEWYQLMMAAFTQDDIVPLVLITELISKSKNKPSIDQLYEGLQLYFGRLHWQIRMTNDLMDVKSKRMKEFKTVKSNTEQTVLTTLKTLAEKKSRVSAGSKSA